MSLLSDGTVHIICNLKQHWQQCPIVWIYFFREEFGNRLCQLIAINGYNILKKKGPDKHMAFELNLSLCEFWEKLLEPRKKNWKFKL